MKNRQWTAALAVATMLAAGAFAQRVPGTPDEVAHPGGQLPGNPKIALVKVAGGFHDPTNVANAGDGSGRMFVVERVGRVRIVNKDGTVQKEPFLDLTNINPLGNDVQTGFVEQGLYSIAFHPQIQRERLLLRALRFAAVQRRRRDRAIPGGPGQPRPHDPRAHQSDRQGAACASSSLTTTTTAGRSSSAPTATSTSAAATAAGKATPMSRGRI